MKFVLKIGSFFCNIIGHKNENLRSNIQPPQAPRCEEEGQLKSKWKIGWSSTDLEV